MAKYLDPKNDLVFKRVFGEHPNILRAFLNALLPLGPSEKIVSLEYLAPEQAPVIPTMKCSIVDVRCRDREGRQFLVEMQMQWTISFMQRVYFNASQAYVNQLRKGEDFKLVQPVFGLNLVNDIFAPGKPDFYHHYKMVNLKDPQQEIKGLQLVFIELPKFTETMSNDPELVAWIRYLIETDVWGSNPEELAVNRPEMAEALHLAEVAAYSPDQLIGYQRYWDAVSTEKMIRSDLLEEGIEIGEARGIEIAEAKAREAQTKALEKLVARGMSLEARAILGIEKAD